MRQIDADALVYALTEMVRHSTGEYKHGIDAARLVAMEAPTVGGWISVRDRLPDMLEPFWAACKSLTDDRDNWTIEGIYKGTTFGGPWGVPIVAMGKAEVYAWKPKEIPEPPKEGNT